MKKEHTVFPVAETSRGEVTNFRRSAAQTTARKSLSGAICLLFIHYSSEERVSLTASSLKLTYEG